MGTAPCHSWPLAVGERGQAPLPSRREEHGQEEGRARPGLAEAAVRRGPFENEL